MIGDGLFNSQLNMIETVLKRLDLFEGRNPSPDYTLGASFFRKLTYRQVWEVCFKEYRYNFLLSDRSLLTFQRSGQHPHNGELRYAYYECPFDVKPYDDFCREIIGNEDTHGDWGAFDELFRDDYEEYVSQCDARLIVTPVRYDYKSSDYRPGCHPASHVHFGHGSNIRVGTKRVMLPLSFVLLILRQIYPDKWARFLAWDECEQLCRNVREALDGVHGDYWNLADEKEVYLH